MPNKDQYFLDFDGNGLLVGRYIDAVHGKNIPKTAVACDTDLFDRTILEQDGLWVLMTDGRIVKTAFSEPTEVDRMMDYLNQLSGYIDRAAIAWGYDSMLAAVSYSSSSSPVFKHEAELLLAWRDRLWDAALLLQAGVVEGSKPAPPSFEALVQALPPIPVKPEVGS